MEKGAELYGQARLHTKWIHASKYEVSITLNLASMVAQDVATQDVGIVAHCLLHASAYEDVDAAHQSASMHVLC